ncbi:MAG TPA: GNAT family N-acetyltransferase [Frankiaceae bacterium]|nr:GNAT family N-acetyltransferase [Frankiaceae bacterium]
MTTLVAPTAGLGPELLAAVRATVLAAFGDRFSDDDWDHTLGGTHVVRTDGAGCVAHAAVVPRTLYVAGSPVRAGYVEAVATRPDAQRRGHGTSVMRAVAEVLRGAYDLGALSTGSPEFYERLGWERWLGATYVRDGGALRPAPDEGVLVLRYGAGAAVDLRAGLACEARSGDDW